MLKIIILAVLAVLVGLGGGSAFSVLKAKNAFASQGAMKAKVVSDSLAKSEVEGSQHAAPTVPADSSGKRVDSTQAGPVEASSGDGAPGAPDDSSSASSTAKSAHSAPAKGAAAATPLRAGTTWNRAVATVESGATATPSAGLAGLAALRRPSLPPKVPEKAAAPALVPERIGKIFAAMPAKDAAKVLVQLDDTDVQSILGAVNAKQAAAILQNFPPVRAAAISKAALRGGATKP